VIGPVKLALVVTVDANVAVAALPPILKLATGVVDVTIIGAVPSAIVEVNWVPDKAPVVVSDVPVAAPILGVTNVGDAFITNVFPVPVWDAILVAFPTLVIGPVRLALVVTVPAVNPAAVPVMFVPTNADGVPRFGVISVGEVFITKVLPVPVCEATLVTLPTLVIGPVKFALVALFPSSF
jgi:hypothetical protein